jgi:hypothetical protein
MGLEVRRCLPLLRRRSLLGFLGAYSGGRTGSAVATGYMRGGAGALSRNGQAKSSSKSSPKRSASLMYEDGGLRWSSDGPVGHDG